MSWPAQDLRKLARAAVARPGAHRWFVCFPPPLAWLDIGYVHRGAGRWIVASKGAPRWV